MKVYLSGPITGKVDGNREVFASTKKILENHGWKVINPYDTNPAEEEAEEAANRAAGKFYSSSYWRLLAKDVATIGEVEGIVFLSGWEDSKGARLEAYVGILKGLPIWEYLDVLDTGEVQLEELKHAYIAGICAAQWCPKEILIKLGLAA
jgi:Domain of unknown function (DUF4406)